jgi:hypothetical protein
LISRWTENKAHRAAGLDTVFWYGRKSLTQKIEYVKRNEQLAAARAARVTQSR